MSGVCEWWLGENRQGATKKQQAADLCLTIHAGGTWFVDLTSGSGQAASTWVCEAPVSTEHSSGAMIQSYEKMSSSNSKQCRKYLY